MNFCLSHEMELLFLICLSAAGYFWGYFSRKGRFAHWSGPLVSGVLIGGICLFKIFEPGWASGFGYYFCYGMGLSFVMAFAIPVGIAGVVDRVPTRNRRIAVWVLSVLTLFVSGYIPTTAAMWVSCDLAGKVTTFTPNGVCLQSTDYTCGPAAAVTALGELGIDADEGAIAVAVRTSPLTGTRIGDLCQYLDRAYRFAQVRCRIERVESVDGLAGSGPFLVSLRESAFTSHCVAVLEVRVDKVVLADPWVGIRTIGKKRFASLWNKRALVLAREGISARDS